MNTGFSIFLIFLLIVGVFAGAGYLLSDYQELSERLVEKEQAIVAVKEENKRLTGQLEKAIPLIEQERSARLEAENRINELEAQAAILWQTLQAERSAKEAAQAEVLRLKSRTDSASQDVTIQPQAHLLQDRWSALSKGQLSTLAALATLAFASAGGFGIHIMMSGKAKTSPVRTAAAKVRRSPAGKTARFQTRSATRQTG